MLRRAKNPPIRQTTHWRGRSWTGRKSGRSRWCRFLLMCRAETTLPFLGFSLSPSLHPVHPLFVIRIWSQLVWEVFIQRWPARITFISHFNHLYPLRNHLSTCIQSGLNWPCDRILLSKHWMLCQICPALERHGPAAVSFPFSYRCNFLDAPF